MNASTPSAAPVYAGFWIRLWASVIDTVLLLAITAPILNSVYGSAYWEADRLIHGPLDFLVSWIFPAVAVIAFWIYRSATPGKMLVGVKIVDARTLGQPTTGQCIGRYLGYYVSMLALFLGFLWVAFDPRKQGFHDKLAGTVVVRTGRQSAAAMNPEGRSGNTD